MQVACPGIKAFLAVPAAHLARHILVSCNGSATASILRRVSSAVHGRYECPLSCMSNSNIAPSESYSPPTDVDSKQQREKRTHCKTMLSWFSRLLHPSQSKGEPSSTQGDQQYASSAGTRPAKAAGDITSGSGHRADGKVTYGYSLVRGKRFTMEDCVFAKFVNEQDQEVGLFGVFDGHGGAAAAEFVKGNLFQNMLANDKFFGDDLVKAIEEAFLETDKHYLNEDEQANRDDGCTAVIAVLTGKRLVVANVGDSRAILSRNGKAMAMSIDHKPNREDERQRIEEAGGAVVWAGTWRVGGVLAVSRAFGDRLLKRYVIADPYIVDERVENEDDALIMATDGLWDVVSNQEAASLIKDIKDPEKAAKRLTDEALNRGSNDNISVVVVKFTPQ